MLGLILVVSCIKRLEIIRIISDKDRNVAAMFHQVLLMFCLKVTAPLQRRGAHVNVEKTYSRGRYQAALWRRK